MPQNGAGGVPGVSGCPAPCPLGPQQETQGSPSPQPLAKASVGHRLSSGAPAPPEMGIQEWGSPERRWSCCELPDMPQQVLTLGPLLPTISHPSAGFRTHKAGVTFLLTWSKAGTISGKCLLGREPPAWDPAGSRTRGQSRGSPSRASGSPALGGWGGGHEKAPGLLLAFQPRPPPPASVVDRGRWCPGSGGGPALAVPLLWLPGRGAPPRALCRWPPASSLARLWVMLEHRQTLSHIPGAPARLGRGWGPESLGILHKMSGLGALRGRGLCRCTPAEGWVGVPAAEAQGRRSSVTGSGSRLEHSQGHGPE